MLSGGGLGKHRSVGARLPIRWRARAPASYWSTWVEHRSHVLTSRPIRWAWQCFFWI
jgi:hypothetical protein